MVRRRIQGVAVFLAFSLQTNLKCIVVDEALLVSWGEGSLDEEPFREAFGRIGELRSFACENVPILCLSVDHDNSGLITVSCGLTKKGCKIIFPCSDRPNIKLSVVKCPEKC